MGFFCVNSCMIDSHIRLMLKGLMPMRPEAEPVAQHEAC
jgi:hypothetical protein